MTDVDGSKLPLDFRFREYALKSSATSDTASCTNLDGIPDLNTRVECVEASDASERAWYRLKTRSVVDRVTRSIPETLERWNAETRTTGGESCHPWPTGGGRPRPVRHRDDVGAMGTCFGFAQEVGPPPAFSLSLFLSFIATGGNPFSLIIYVS